MNTINFKLTEKKYEVSVSGIQLLELMLSERLEAISGVIMVAYDGERSQLVITVDANADTKRVQDDIINVIIDISSNR